MNIFYNLPHVIPSPHPQDSKVAIDNSIYYSWKDKEKINKQMMLCIFQILKNEVFFFW